MRPRQRRGRAFQAVVLAAGFALATALPAAPGKADPPPWAPAHGWRDKHHRHHGGEDDDDRGPPVYVVPAPTYVVPAPQAIYVAPPPPPPPTYVVPYGLAQGTCHRDLIGAALGGAAGGLIGSQFGHGSGKTAATLGGVVLGLLVGGTIGRGMDEVDQACVNEALEYAPDRETVAWQGSGAYRVTPVKTWRRGKNWCREYRTVAVIGGHTRTVTGTACRQPDGAWRIVN